MSLPAYEENALQRFARMKFLPILENVFGPPFILPVWISIPIAAIGIVTGALLGNGALIGAMVALLVLCAVYFGMVRLALDEDDRYCGYTTLALIYGARDLYRAYCKGEISHEEYERRFREMTKDPDEEYADPMALEADELASMSEEQFNEWLQSARLRG